FVQNCFTSRRSAVVIAKGIFAFSNAAGFVGASSQFLRSARETYFASFGSSTSWVAGKLSVRIKDAFVAAISLMRWYSFPPALIIYCTPNSSPILSALISLHLSLASKICGRFCSSFHAWRLIFIPSFAGLVLYHWASR